MASSKTPPSPNEPTPEQPHSTVHRPEIQNLLSLWEQDEFLSIVLNEPREFHTPVAISMLGEIPTRPTNSIGENLAMNTLEAPSASSASVMFREPLDENLPEHIFLPRRPLYQREPSVSEDSLAFSPARSTPSPSFPPTIRLYTEKQVNLTNFAVWFKALAFDIPPENNLHPSMIQGFAESPSGTKLPCSGFGLARKENPYDVDTFTACFRTIDETGMYFLNVRLAFDPNQPVVYERLPISVSRNHYRASDTLQRLYQVEHVRVYKVGAAPHYLQPPQRAPRQMSKTQDDGAAGGGSLTGGEFPYSKLWGLAADKQCNRLFYTDRLGNAFHCIDALTGQKIFRFPPAGGFFPAAFVDKTELSCPTGICYDAFNQRILLCDKDNHRVLMFSSDGYLIGSFGCRGHADGQFFYPWDVAVTGTGDLIAVTDSRNKRIQVFDRHGQFRGKFSVYEDQPFLAKGNFEYPRGITFSNDGSLLYVTDFNVNTIHEIPVSLETNRKILPDGSLNRPQGIAVDSYDNLLVADSKNKAVRHVFPRERLMVNHILRIGGERLLYPLNVATLAYDRVAVLDYAANILIF